MVSDEQIQGDSYIGRIIPGMIRSVACGGMTEIA